MRTLKVTLFSLVLLGALLTAFILAERAGVFVIQDITVRIESLSSNQNFYADKEVRLTHLLEQMKGKQLWRISLGEASQQVTEHEWIEQVQIFRRIPNRLEVRVKAKPIVLVYQNPRGKLLPVAADGSLLKAAQMAELPDVPILRGREFGQNPDLRLKAVALVQELPTEGKLTARAISEILFKDGEGFQLLLHSQHAKIQMGQNDFQKKAERVSHVLSYLEAQGIESRMIDASYLRKVLVKIKKKN